MKNHQPWDKELRPSQCLQTDHNEKTVGEPANRESAPRLPPGVSAPRL